MGALESAQKQHSPKRFVEKRCVMHFWRSCLAFRTHFLLDPHGTMAGWPKGSETALKIPTPPPIFAINASGFSSKASRSLKPLPNVQIITKNLAANSICLILTCSPLSFVLGCCLPGAVKPPLQRGRGWPTRPIGQRIPSQSFNWITTGATASPGRPRGHSPTPMGQHNSPVSEDPGRK